MPMLPVVPLIVLAHLCAAFPTGLSLFFDSSDCPQDWRPLVIARGRLIVSVIDPTLAGVTVGSPLRDQEDRTHAHAYATTVILPSKHIAADGCCDKQGAASGSYPVNNVTHPAPSGYPFTQVLLCEYRGTDDGTPIAFGTVAYFSEAVSECPKEWEPAQNAAGRFLVPSYESGGAIENVATPLASGEDRRHAHQFVAEIPSESVSYEGVDGCCNDSPAAAMPITLEGTTANASAGLPYVQMLTCASRQSTFNLSLPTEALVYNSFACPPGWTVENALAGRFLVGLPTNGTAGASFGGRSLPPLATANPIHTHTMQGTMSFPHSSIGLAAGCCADGYLKGESYAYQVPTDGESDDLPYIMMSLCRRKQ